MLSSLPAFIFQRYRLFFSEKSTYFAIIAPQHGIQAGFSRSGLSMVWFNHFSHWPNDWTAISQVTLKKMKISLIFLFSAKRMQIMCTLCFFTALIVDNMHTVLYTCHIIGNKCSGVLWGLSYISLHYILLAMQLTALFYPVIYLHAFLVWIELSLDV